LFTLWNPQTKQLFVVHFYFLVSHVEVVSSCVVERVLGHTWKLQ